MSARRRCAPRPLLALVALVCAAAAILHFASPSPAQAGSSRRPLAAPAPQASRGRTLFIEGCASCHGYDARGTIRGPSLYGAGAGSADFYLSTGRMPLSAAGDYPSRAKPQYSRPEIGAITAYVGSLGRPFPIPHVQPSRGSLSEGFELFTTNCAGCHSQVARGGIVTGAIAPPLDDRDITPTDVAEAIRIGPDLMPVFGQRQISAGFELDSLARFVLQTRHTDDKGGWGIGHIGPIPEGMVAWLLGLVSLLIVARLIGQRTPR